MTKTVAILGVGLIGGSLGMALRQAGYAVKGYSRNKHNQAVALGAVDSLHTQLEPTVQGADIIVLATPVGAYHRLLQDLLPLWQKNWVVTDVGSTKQSVVADVESVLTNEQCSQMVYAHPIAGREQAGVEAAQVALFRQAQVVLCWEEHTVQTAWDIVERMWQAAGALCMRMGVLEHDSVLAKVSHLPHILAYSLVNHLAQSKDSAACFQLAAGGFTDFSRIASSSPQMWCDILHANWPLIDQALGGYIQQLQQLQQMMHEGDEEGVHKWLTDAKQKRDTWLEFQNK